MSSIPDVSWPRIGGFVRQYTHDLRNELNGLDLEAALLADIVTDPEALEGVGRMRAEIRKVAADLRALSAKFSEARPSLMVLSAEDLFLIWQDEWKKLSPLPNIEWTNELGAAEVNVDPTALAEALREVLANAQSFGTGKKLTIRAAVVGREVVFTLREPKGEAVDPQQWGKSPFLSTRRGGYGLGLCSVLRAVEASGGRLEWQFDPKESALVTTISLPAA